ncbi:MAG: hypothetical protein K0U12_06380 [Gammaproteobacteria bacterium]|nr:hypothetical protein [Gammaproteobacteria bacterium]
MARVEEPRGVVDRGAADGGNNYGAMDQVAGAEPVRAAPTFSQINEVKLSADVRQQARDEAKRATCGNYGLWLGLMTSLASGALGISKLLVDDGEAEQIGIAGAELALYLFSLGVNLREHISKIEDIQALFYQFARWEQEDGTKRFHGVYKGVFCTSGLTFLVGVGCALASIGLHVANKSAANFIDVAAPFVTGVINAVRGYDLDEQFRQYEKRFIELSPEEIKRDYSEQGGIQAYQHLKRGLYRFFITRKIYNEAEIRDLSGDNRALPFQLR